jgi:hypothetical protein
MRAQRFLSHLLSLAILALSGCTTPRQERHAFLVSATARPDSGGLAMDIIHPASLKGTSFLLYELEPQATEQMTGKTWMLQLRDRTVVELVKQADYKHGYNEHVRSGADPLAYDGYFPPRLRLSDLAAPPTEINSPREDPVPATPPKY